MFSVIRNFTVQVQWTFLASLLRVSALFPNGTQQQHRSLTYYSVKKAKRKTVKSVVYRFMRLHCGLWIRRKVQVFNCHIYIAESVFSSDLFLFAHRPDTKRNCGRRNLPAASVWGSMSFVTKPKANFWIKWPPLFGGGGIGMLMIHTRSIMIGLI